MGTLRITIVDDGRRGFRVALTDGQHVYRRRRWRSATTACIDVYRRLRRGHRLAFPSALAALERDAGDELAQRLGAMAAD
jgi:hypothetical protein